MPLAVKDDESPDPAGVRLLGAKAVVARAKRGTHAVEKLHPFAG
jgi:hypothetical protein